MVQGQKDTRLSTVGPHNLSFSKRLSACSLISYSTSAKQPCASVQLCCLLHQYFSSCPSFSLHVYSVIGIFDIHRWKFNNAPPFFSLSFFLLLLILISCHFIILHLPLKSCVFLGVILERNLFFFFFIQIRPKVGLVFGL